MQIVRDEALVKRRSKIARITSMAGLGILIAGMAFMWLAPRWDVPMQLVLYAPLLALLVGFILSQVGIYYTNRWGRSPRPDEIIDQSLKGLGKENKLYHYTRLASHLLLMPGGPVVIVPRNEMGAFTVDGEKWKQKLTAWRVLSFLGREGVGNPTKDALYQADRIKQFLVKNAPELEDVPVQAVIVFLSDRVVLNVGETSVPVVRATKLKGFVRSEAGRGKPLPKPVFNQVQALFDTAAGVDAA